ncbi:MAG: CDP-diacylglycerol--glycerol-3-phosphate 3-phosphatidyltransferase [Ruminococcaceae bacterium]|nr:CDP-diacylglycerol--glycerol-3-phosphate 3-phosphatidyltransferase [Oscillospiraceae bacterium]
MNLPNKLTILRVILVPFFLAAMMIPDSIVPEYITRIIAAVIFAVTALTDFVDGKIARKYNLVTNFGKFMDPLADKFMVIAALLGATARYEYLTNIFVWITLIVVFRELAITSLRLIASSTAGKVIAAAWAGKIKTFSQCICILAIFLEPLIPHFIFNEYHVITWISAAVMTFFTIYSGIQYFIAYKEFLSQD